MKRLTRRMGEAFLNMGRIYWREFQLVFSDIGLVLFFIFLPLAYPVIYSLIYNPELVRNVSLVVVDNDRTAESRSLIQKMDASEGANVIGYAVDLPDARKAMDSHECYGILEIPEGFAERLGRGEQAPAVMYCEMSLLLRYRALLVSCTDVMQQMGAELQVEKIEEAVPMATSLMTGDPMGIENINMGNSEAGFCSFIMPGVLVLILHQCLVLAIGMSGGAKHEDPYKIGYLPYNHYKSVLGTMVGQMLCYVTIMLIPVIFLIHYVPMIFSLPQNGNVWEELAFLLPLVISAVSLGFCLQGLIFEREAIFVVWVVTSVILLFLSGLTWPHFAINGFWRILSDICPSTWGVEGFIQMNTNGASLSQVGVCYRNLWICAGCYFILAYFVQGKIIHPLEERNAAKYFKNSGTK